MSYPIVLDLETKYTFRKYSDPKKLGISVVAIYDYKTNKSFTFMEKDIHHLFKFLEKASFIIGFNILGFDLPVLQGYYPGNIFQFKTLDILEEVKKVVGRRLALNDLIMATLNKKKTGHGLQAIEYYHQGKIEKLKEYCLSDVLLTKELFDFGVKNGIIYYLDASGKVPIKVEWQKLLNNDSSCKEINLTLPL